MAGSSVGSNDSRGRRGLRSGKGPAAAEGFPGTLCSFWLGTHCFAIPSSIVGEVVTVESLTPVPLAPGPVRGLFNLRGTPVAAVDLGAALTLAEAPAVEEPRAGQPLIALVLRAGDLMVGVLIRRMEMVVPAGRGRFRPRGDSGEESPLVVGFLEIAERGSLVMTVLGAEEVLDRLGELRLQRGDDE
jgi:chemotaxis signal transduction protein